MIELKGKTERWREGGSSRWLGNGCHLQLLIGRVKPSACSVVGHSRPSHLSELREKKLWLQAYIRYEPLSSRLRFHTPPPPQLSNRSLSRCVFVDKISRTELVEFLRNEKRNGGGEMIIEKDAKFVNVGCGNRILCNRIESWNDNFREIMLRHRIILRSFHDFFKFDKETQENKSRQSR